jgi:hypothetical protein
MAARLRERIDLPRAKFGALRHAFVSRALDGFSIATRLIALAARNRARKNIFRKWQES